MEFKFFKVEELKDEIIEILTSMETKSSDDVACERITSIADKIDEIVLLTKKDKVLSRTPVVIKSLKEIQSFSEKLLSIIRGRSWHAICSEFNPSVTIENIKTLKSTLTKSLKKSKELKEPKPMEEPKPEPIGGGGLVDDIDFIKYSNKISKISVSDKHQKDIDRVKKEQAIKISQRDEKLKKQLELREKNRDAYF